MEKEDLEKIVLNIVKYTLNVIPWIGLVNYIEWDIQKNREKGVPAWKIGGKLFGHFAWSALTTSYLLVGTMGFGWNPLEDGVKPREPNERTEKLANYKSSVTNFVDTDNNGLSNKEDYQIKELMGIQDSSKNYVPTSQDWERAYDKIKSLEKFSEQ